MITNIQHPNYAFAAVTPIDSIIVRTINFGTNTILDEVANYDITNLSPGFYIFI